MTNWHVAVAAAILWTAAASPSKALEAPAASSILAELAAKDRLSADDLVTVAGLAESGRGRDLAVLAGKPFLAVVTPDQADAEGPRWWYDSAHQALSLHAPIGRLSGDFFDLPGCPQASVSARGVEIRREGASRNVDGQTPDGARQTYDSVEQHRVSLGRLICGPPPPASGLNADLNENGARAHDQLASLQATIEGVLQPVGDGAMVACAGEAVGATTEKPTELVIRQCVVGASIRRIAFWAGGVELASWGAADTRPRTHGKRRWMPRLPPMPRLQDLH